MKVDQVSKVYFNANKAGKLKLSVFSEAVHSKIKLSISSKSKMIELKGEAETMAGEWDIIKEGYGEIHLVGIEKQGNTFGEISAFGISGSCLNSETAFVRNNEGNYFYWGRRGPSVHLNYNTDGLENIEWFYSEITAPEKNNEIGPYYMATGFG